jgi:alpha-D-xyloside xylohydrolase
MTDEFMFGQSILAAPIVDPQYTQEKIVREDAMTGWNRKDNDESESASASVDWTATKTATNYLPKGSDWYDFWTGRRLRGGQSVGLTTSLNRVPMYVRAGSIIPLAPEMEYVGQLPWNNLELRVYPGADAHATLYEDEGDNYNYEQGVYATIPIDWNDRTRTLTIGQQQGRYPGMLQQRRFTVVLPDATTQVVDYSGQPVSVKL